MYCAAAIYVPKTHMPSNATWLNYSMCIYGENMPMHMPHMKLLPSLCCQNFCTQRMLDEPMTTTTPTTTTTKHPDCIDWVGHLAKPGKRKDLEGSRWRPSSVYKHFYIPERYNICNTAAPGILGASLNVLSKVGTCISILIWEKKLLFQYCINFV